MQDIVIIGGGGHALSIADSISEYTIFGYTDKTDMNNGLRYLGTDNILIDLYRGGVHCAVLGIGYLGNDDVRPQIIHNLREIGYSTPMVIDKSAVISNTVVIGEGTFIGKNAVVNAYTVIGKMCIINTASILEHSNYVGDYSHIAVGAVLCGNVSVGKHTLIGANATIIQGVHIGSRAIIGAGSIVLSDVPDNTIVKGVWKR